MATINSGFTPYYIQSSAIAVFPCANRTSDYASRFTTEYNLTHLGLPNASWISKVTGQNADKETGNEIALTDKISCVINGYLFEFSLSNAYDKDGTQLTLGSNESLTAYIATEAIGDDDDPDPLKMQPQLCALHPSGNASAFDMTLAPAPGPLFLGLIIIKGTGSPISGGTTYSLQLAYSGNYPYIGFSAPVQWAESADHAGTANEAEWAEYASYLDRNGINTATKKLVTNVYSTTKELLGVKLTGGVGAVPGDTISVQLTGGVATDNIYNGAITSEKFADGARAPKAEIANTIQIGDDAYALSLGGNVLTLTKV